MLPDGLLLHRIDGELIVPSYLGRADAPWIERLLERHAAFVGLPRRLLVERLRDGLGPDAPRAAVRLAMRVLEGLWIGEVVAAIPPARARREVHLERARSSGSRDGIVATVADRIGIPVVELERALHADRPSHRLVGRLPSGLDAWSLVLRINLALAQGFMSRASGATIDLEGNARRIVQQATWQGLIPVVRGTDPCRCRVEISGPLSVVHRSRLYGRALASVVPLLPWCARFRLEAPCRVGGRDLVFELSDDDEIARGVEPRRHDSRIEQAFEADFLRTAPDWALLREPRAVVALGSLIFPDFAIWRWRDPSARVLVEIVGYWGREYLEAKIARLRDARCERLIACVAERLLRGGGVDVGGLEVIAFRRRVDVGAVIARAVGLLGG